jgi:hypothetical protein
MCDNLPQTLKHFSTKNMKFPVRLAPATALARLIPGQIADELVYQAHANRYSSLRKL